ncbi:MAG: LamG-like jellyroll fold domain-containing protein [Bacteroidia bacterium]
MKILLHSLSLLIFALTTLDANAQTLTDSLIAYYPFDGDTKDYSGNGYDLTNSGASLVANFKNDPNRAYQFDGSTDFMSNVVDTALRPAEYSLSCWMKMDVLPTSGDFSIAIDNGGTLKDNGLQVAHNYQGYNGIGVFTYKLNSPTNSFYVSTGLDTSAWFFYTITRSLDSIILYINGIRSGANYIGDYTGYAGSNLGFYVGNRHGNQKYFSGKLDEIKLWSRALSPSEAAQLYSNTVTSIQEIEFSSSKLIIYPNPSNCSFKVGNLYGTPINILVYNALGQVVLSKVISNNDTEFSLIEKGIYFVKLETPGVRVESIRIIVQ